MVAVTTPGFGVTRRRWPELPRPARPMGGAGKRAVRHVRVAYAHEPGCSPAQVVLRSRPWVVSPDGRLRVTTRRAVPASVYRRRRLVVATATVATAAFTGALLGPLLLAGAASGVLGGGSLTASETGPPVAVVHQARPPSGAVHVVVAGDTLWSIARGLQPTGDVRPLVDRLVEAHGRRLLQVGDAITLPAPSSASSR